MAKPTPATSSSSNVLRFSLDPIFAYPTINDRGENLLKNIASIYEAGNTPEQSTLLMDGTYALMMRSHQLNCATELSAPLPFPVPAQSSGSGSQSSTTPTDNTIHDAPAFQKCRKCSGEYVFELPGGGRVTIIAGAPKFGSIQHLPYKTMSYVWGQLPPSPLAISCLGCKHVTNVPMLSIQRFHNLMALGGAGNTIWLDALSIDQSDSKDISENIAIMGKIYKNATCVSVLLPSSDQAAYECLDAIERDAKVILMHRRNFIDNLDFTFQDPESGETIKVLSTVCEMFIANLKSLSEHLHQLTYWSRAWTFQEWALASDLEIAVEGWPKAQTCFNMKSLVLGAAMLISRYKILQHQYAEIKLGQDISRGMIPPIFNIIKLLFPDEDLFLSYEEVDAKKVSFQTNFPHIGVTDLLGVGSVPPPSNPSAITSEIETEIPTPHSIALAARPTTLAQTRSRLILLLSAFASSKREAKYEADLVACWASMCNIPYKYDRRDSFTTAKRKALDALREQGMVVYNFIPDREYTGGEGIKNAVDIFRAYAREHPQLNATNNAEFPGAPMFSGRADTVLHLIYSLEMVTLPTMSTDDDTRTDINHLPEGMTIAPDATIDEAIALGDDLSSGLASFAKKALYGRIPGLAGFQFWDTQEVAKLYLEKVSSEHRAKAKLVIAQIPFQKHTDTGPLESCKLFLWGVIHTNVPLVDLKICRDPVAGTLALAVSTKDGRHHIISYLVLSDDLSGSYLIKTDEEGRVDLELRLPERGDMMHSTYRQVSIRRLCGRINLTASGLMNDALQSQKVNRGKVAQVFEEELEHCTKQQQN